MDMRSPINKPYILDILGQKPRGGWENYIVGPDCCVFWQVDNHTKPQKKNPDKKYCFFVEKIDFEGKKLVILAISLHFPIVIYNRKM